MSAILNDPEDTYLFAKFPAKIIIDIGDGLMYFLNSTGFVINSQEHQEITRQCFDFIDYGFIEYCRLLDGLPNFRMLSVYALNVHKYHDQYGNMNDLALNIKAATKAYGVSIYMTCVRAGMFHEARTPYILENIDGPSCLLFNGYQQSNS
jgi:hypothetical protein